MITGYRSKWNIPPVHNLEINNISKMLLHLLFLRGYETVDKVKNFLSNNNINYDPFLLPDMKIAHQRIKKAIKKNEHMAIYGDFDVDGISASAIMYEALKAQGTEPTVIIPQRKEGHGLADFRIEELKNKGVSLIITVDCGSSAVSEIEHAQSLGMEVIVTDHHTIPKNRPNCLIVNPTGSSYPFSFISGAGVAYKLAQTLGDTEVLDDLVALGTIADVVPLRDENRTFVLKGLERMKEQRRPGLVALLKSSGVGTDRLSAATIAFYVGPKINSANRMSDPQIAYELLITQSDEQAKELSKKLTISNYQRQEILQDSLAEVVGSIDKDQWNLDVKSGKVAPLMVALGNWPPGISGLIASKLCDIYGVPAICGSENEWGEISASGRSLPGVSMINIISAASQYLHKFGGHEGAGGFSCTKENWPKVIELLQRTAKKEMKGHEPISILNVDAEINFNQVSMYAIEQLDKIAPFGEGFPEPLFMAKNIKLIERKIIGEGKHMQAIARKGWDEVKAVIFNHDLELETTEEDQEFDLVFNINCNVWKGRPELQVLIRDWKLSD